MTRFMEEIRTPSLLIEAIFVMNIPMENHPFQLWMALLSPSLLLEMFQVVSPRNYLFTVLIIPCFSNICLCILHMVFFHVYCLRLFQIL